MRIIVETSKFNKIVEMVNNVNYKIKEQEPTAINSQTICIRTSGKNEVSIIAMNQEMYLNILVVLDINNQEQQELNILEVKVV